NRLRDARAGIERELEERDPGEIARDVDPGNVGGSVRADFRKALHGSRGPPRVEPVGVPGDQAEHGASTIHAPARPRAPLGTAGRYGPADLLSVQRTIRQRVSVGDAESSVGLNMNSRNSAE